ncbi:MAG: DUF4956 domain-containing protein [Kiritimatiellae bacterium]|nr:DUF4956 domain-containing protein [Kiritimatiellia bacterium]
MDNASKFIDEMENALAAGRGELTTGLFVSMILAALVSAFAASFLYRFFYERRGTGSQVHRAFPLLALSITTLFIGLQHSLPLSLGLLGSLSIIRFRTPVKEPEEVGFIMLVIAASICAATANFSFVFWLYAAATLTLLVCRGAAGLRCLGRDGVLVLTLPAAEAAGKTDAIEKALRDGLRRHVLESSSTRNGMTTRQYVFSGLSGDPAAFEVALSNVAGFAAVNIFLDRPGGIR